MPSTLEHNLYSTCIESLKLRSMNFKALTNLHQHSTKTTLVPNNNLYTFRTLIEISKTIF